MRLAPGSAGAPGEQARGEEVALGLKLSPAAVTLFANTFCGKKDSDNLSILCYIAVYCIIHYVMYTVYVVHYVILYIMLYCCTILLHFTLSFVSYPRLYYNLPYYIILC